MKYLNLGCGSHYSKKPEWVNLDFTSSGPGVIEHNLLQGIPFSDNEFDLVYHSHVLEHFSKSDGSHFIQECLRVLKPGGILRIAVPDLEGIVRNYLKFLEEGSRHPEDSLVKANYDWMMLEMYDQTVRSKSGGDMLGYLSQDRIANEDFLFQRIGEEGRSIRNGFLKAGKKMASADPKPSSGLKGKVKDYLLKRWDIDLRAHELGKFRLGGEIHQWMYDRYSLTRLLETKNAVNIQVRDAFSSSISDWASYQLDGRDSVVRKPDSLFIEAIKK